MIYGIYDDYENAGSSPTESKFGGNLSPQRKSKRSSKDVDREVEYINKHVFRGHKETAFAHSTNQGHQKHRSPDAATNLAYNDYIAIENNLQEKYKVISPPSKNGPARRKSLAHLGDLRRAGEQIQ